MSIDRYFHIVFFFDPIQEYSYSEKINIYDCEARALKKIKNETELVREALRIGAIYVEKRKAGKFEETDSSRQKIEYLYRLLVHDKLIQPLVKGQESEQNMKHKLALWISRQLPEGHPLLKSVKTGN